LRAGQIAAAANVNVETLRYYERRGLLDEPARTLGGRRCYPSSSVGRVRMIKTMQRLGFSLNEIADLLRALASSPGKGHEVEVRARAGVKLIEIEQKIADLSAMRDTLRVAVAGGCDDPLAYVQDPAFVMVGASGTLRGGPRAQAGSPGSEPEGQLMTTISTEDPVAVAAAAAIHTGDVATLRQLLGDNPGLARVRLGDDDLDGMSRTLLHVVTDWPGHFPNGAATVAVLVAAGAEVDARFRGPHEETPLHWAASSDDVAVLDALLDAGADIDAPGAVIADGPPLADATAFRCWNVAYRLVERGAQTNLYAAGALGLMDRLEACYAGGDAPPSDETSRAFWAACHGGRVTAAQYLLAEGAELDWIPPWEPLTPLDTATTSGSAELMAWLHARGAKTASQLRGD